MPRKRKKTDEVAVTVAVSRGLTFDLGIPYWDQLVKIAEEILRRRDDVPNDADVSLQGDVIGVDWTE